MIIQSWVTNENLGCFVYHTFCQNDLPFVTLYPMKKRFYLLLILVGVASTSCTSEYEQRLEEGRILVDRLEKVEGTSDYISDNQFVLEVSEIVNEINLLAQVSGNKKLFLQEIYED